MSRQRITGSSDAGRRESRRRPSARLVVASLFERHLGFFAGDAPSVSLGRLAVFDPAIVVALGTNALPVAATLIRGGGHG